MRGLNIVRGRGENPPLEFPLNVETAWLLGIYTAEGWTTENHDVFFALGHDEDSLARNIERIAASLGYSPFIKERETGLNVRFSSSILARALRDWCGHLAENKRMPDFILYHSDIEILKAFIAGYLEGDGNNTIDSRGPEYDRASSTSRVLALQIQLAYARLGLFANVRPGQKGGKSEIMGRQVNTHDSYEIWLQTNRKRLGFDIQPDFIAVPIRSISKVPYSGPVNNIETADNTYLVSNAVVHNCSVEVGAAGGARFDMERFGILEAFGSLRQCDLLIVMGTVTRKLAPAPQADLRPDARTKVDNRYGRVHDHRRPLLRLLQRPPRHRRHNPGRRLRPRLPAAGPRRLMQGLVLLQEKIRTSHSIGGQLAKMQSPSPAQRLPQPEDGGPLRQVHYRRFPQPRSDYTKPRRFKVTVARGAHEGGRALR